MIKLKNLLRSDLCVIALLTMLAFMASVVIPYDVGDVQCAWLWQAVAGLVSAIGNIGSSLLGSASNTETNETNQDINERNIQLAKETNELNAALQRETNAQNYKIFQEQNAFNLDMWNKQNEYNSPAKEVQRLLAAGINPASKFGSSTAASSITSANAAPQVSPQMQSPVASLSMRPYDFGGMRDVGINAVNAFNASQLANAETKNKNALTSGITLDNTLKSKGMADNLQLLKNMAKEKGIVGDIARRNLDFLNATFDLDMQMKYGDFLQQSKSIDMLEKQMLWQDIQNDTASIVLAYQDELSRAQIASIWKSVDKCNAEIGLIGANQLLTYNMAATEVEKRVSQILDNGMKGIDLQIKDKTKTAIMQSAYEDLKAKKISNQFGSARNQYGEARVRLIGTGSKRVPETRLERGFQKLWNFYDRGVQQGINKRRR